MAVIRDWVALSDSGDDVGPSFDVKYPGHLSSSESYHTCSESSDRIGVQVASRPCRGMRWTWVPEQAMAMRRTRVMDCRVRAMRRAVEKRVRKAGRGRRVMGWGWGWVGWVGEGWRVSWEGAVGVLETKARMGEEGGVIVSRGLGLDGRWR